MQVNRITALIMRRPSVANYSITVTYIDKDGTEHQVQAPIGKNLLEVAHDNEIDLEGVMIRVRFSMVFKLRV